MNLRIRHWMLAAMAGYAASAGAAQAQQEQQRDAAVRRTYAERCAGCHGEDARGSQQGPGLEGSASLRRRNAQSIRNLIVRGVPSAGMPGSPDLESSVLDGLVTLVQSLNASAADSQVPGDREAGRAYFFGSGRCSQCHMVRGAGSAAGPDLSNIAREMTVGQLRQSLTEPGARLAPGYGLVSVQLRGGTTVRGFARARTRFGIVVQAQPSQSLQTIDMALVERIVEHPASAMPALAVGGGTLQNLLAFLSTLKGVPEQPLDAAPAANSTAPEPSFEAILRPDPQDWITYNGQISGNRRSPLTKIGPDNVSGLSLRWSFSIPLWTQFLPDTPYYHENMRYFGLETVPIVAGGIMYVTGPNQVFALDARSGQQIWHYSRPRTPGLVSDPSLGTNRGVAILGDKLFLVTDNAHLLAVHRVTGRLMWEVVMPDEPQRYGGTLAPLIVKDMVVAGVAGGDWGIRGFLAAYKADTGQRVWRHWTVPDKGEPGSETWIGGGYKLGGAGTWLTGSYDPSTDTLFWATGNPWPNSDDRDRGGDNLYTDSVLALDPANGRRKWHYQFTPHDVHDWDSNVPNVLVDAPWQGRERKLLLHADRNGFFYVFDRVDGTLLLAKSFMHRVTWSSGIGPDGRPLPAPPSNLTCPDHATNWNGSAFSPVTRLYYVMATEKCTVRLSPGSWRQPRPAEEPGVKYLRAIDIETGRIAWEVPQVGPVDGKRVAGILSTASGLLFYGDPSGYFVAADERDGRTLWKLPLHATIKTSPVTYAVDGVQYVTLAAGSNVMTFALGAGTAGK